MIPLESDLRQKGPGARGGRGPGDLSAPAWRVGSCVRVRRGSHFSRGLAGGRFGIEVPMKRQRLAACARSGLVNA